jgi:protein-S-isoprenylcysteine O-methyltransferase Ste14
MVLGTWGSIALFSFFPLTYRYLLPFWYFEFPWLQHIGFGVLLVSFIWIVVAQAQMEDSWRIGINYNEKTHLMTTGLFKISRNPIFLGVIVSYIGTFLIIPNALSFAVVIVTIVVLQIQVRLEEVYLTKMHGSSYTKYCSSVRRWI